MSAIERITLQNDMSQLAEASDWLMAWAGARQLPEKLAFSLRLCLEEALANIVMHAFDGGNHAIIVEASQQEGEVAIQFQDDGKPFDPLSQAPNPDRDPLEDEKLGGYGLILLQKFTKAIEYERIGAMNSLTLRFAHPADTPPPDR